MKPWLSLSWKICLVGTDDLPVAVASGVSSLALPPGGGALEGGDPCMETLAQFSFLPAARSLTGHRILRRAMCVVWRLGWVGAAF